MPRSIASCSSRASSRRPIPSPRASGAVHNRFTSAVAASGCSFNAPQPTGTPFAAATRSSPRGGVISSSLAEMLRAGSNPLSNRLASSSK